MLDFPLDFENTHLQILNFSLLKYIYKWYYLWAWEYFIPTLGAIQLQMQLRSKYLKAAIQNKMHNILLFGKQEDKLKKHKSAYSALKKNLQEK